MAYLKRSFNPGRQEYQELLKRNIQNKRAVEQDVRNILDAVRTEGDSSLFRFSKQFDKVELSSLSVGLQELLDAESLVDDSLRQALHTAYDHIYAFHAEQLGEGEQLEVAKGIDLSRMIVPIQRVGLYIPGGTAPLFSTVLMLAIPALVAKCPSVVLCTPPAKDGSIHPAILYAAKLCNITEIYKVGGAQAIAAMGYGTQTIKAVDKIFGPGNQYVTEAKIQISSECCAIDMPAGPSEVMVVASLDADPAFVASDLLSQAEHGSDSQAMLIVNSDQEQGFAYLDRVELQLEKQLAKLPRQSFLLQSLAASRAIVAPSLDSCLDLVNAYGPEHLIINLSEKDDELFASKVVNAGSIFIGPYSCESAGDYASGTNHTLPTNGWARSYSGVSTDSYCKKITVQKLSKEGLMNLSGTLFCMAESEALMAHYNAVAVRLGGEK
ncbi:MAG: histidinol dehydrogenase [Spirochaetia bacterium]|nr:histidinol dehydrogenase [Spirochaetia bacterium]